MAGGTGRVSRDGDGKPVRMVGINMDITEPKQAEEALRDGDRRKDEFLATLAHELRTRWPQSATACKH